MFLSSHGVRLAAAVVAGAVIATAVPVHSENAAESAVPLDGVFFLRLSKTPTIRRDQVLRELMNRTIVGRGVVESIVKRERYRKKFCIVASDPHSSQYGIHARYYVFVEREDAIALIRRGVTIEFTGQCMAYTPVTSLRTAYILDIVFERGAVIVE